MTISRSLLCHMAILLEDGSTAENTLASGKPVRLNIGDGSLSPAFEAELSNLNANDKHNFTLEPMDAFGDINPDSIHYLDKSRFASDMALDSGVIVNFDSANGSQIPGIIRSVEGDSVTVDFNHPLAGHKVTFELEVVKVL